MSASGQTGSGGFPTGEALHKADRWRHRTGRVWAMMFMASTLVGIVALMALIISIVNDLRLCRGAERDRPRFSSPC